MHSTSPDTLVLKAADIHEIVSNVGIDQLMDELIQAVSKGLLDFDPSQLHIPMRAGFNYEKPASGLVEWMPLYRTGKEVLVKVVGYHPEAPLLHNLPTILSTVSLYDTSSGHLTGLIDGVLLTALRTGAASAVATDILSASRSRCLGLIGSGAQSMTQLHAISRIRPISEVLYTDIDQDTIDSFETRARPLGIRCSFRSASVSEILAMSDIICTATSIPVGAGPLFDEAAHQSHLHINAVGSDFPGKTELPISLLERALVVPDFTAQAMIEGECQQLTGEQIGPSIDELVQGSGPGHQFKEKLTVFDSTGWALEDYIAAKVFLRHAENLGIGSRIEIEYMPADEKNPYEFLQQTESLKNTDQVSSRLHPVQSELT